MIETARDSTTHPFYAATLRDPDFLQGDVVAFESEVPVIGSEGDVVALDTVKHWLVAANSCDLARAPEDVDYVPIVPIIAVPVAEGSEDAKAGFRRAITRYEVTDVFYLPGWDDAGEMAADFTRFVSVHREALKARATIAARMQLPSWVLFNACLVRHLCRADKRNVSNDDDDEARSG